MSPTDKSEPDFSSLRGFCADIKAIQPSEYIERQARLADTLPEGGAFVMEPGPTMLYYTNIQWSLTERPFLVVLQRAHNSSDVTTTVVTPMFEATRAAEAIRNAALPKEISVQVVEWLEHGSPYETTAELLENASHVFVEPGVRLFVYDGLEKILSQQHGVVTTMASRALQTLRMVKSSAEIAILRCANHATVAAAKQVRRHVKPGMTEADIATLVTQALTTAGLTNTWVLALVDENAALPHGRAGTTQRVTDHSTVLIDSGGELLGYQSDVTRTFFMDNNDRNSHNQTIVDAWYLVKNAQKAVLHDAHAGSTCAQVDLAARHVIDRAGYGRYFTHRLGHGIGEEMHEEPYVSLIGVGVPVQHRNKGDGVFHISKHGILTHVYMYMVDESRQHTYQVAARNDF